MEVLFKKKGKVTYENLDEYFDYVSNTMGFPKLHEEFEQAEILSDGLKLHVDVREYSKSAPTLVFMPGTAVYSLCYAEFLYKLSEQGFNIVGFDPRGHGQSEGTRGDYTIEELMRDASAAVNYAIERFGDNVSLMGSSQGGIVAFYLAATDSRIKSAVCQNFADLTAPESAQLTRYPRLSKYMKPLLLKFGSVVPSTQIPVGVYLDLEQIKVKYFGNAKNFMSMDPLALQSISFRSLTSLASTQIPKPVEEITTPVFVFQVRLIVSSLLITPDTSLINCAAKNVSACSKGLIHAIMVEDADIIVHPIAEWLREIHHV